MATVLQDAVIEYLREENRVLKQQLGRRRLRLTDDQRRLEIVGITPGPDEPWMMQVGRNLTDLLDGFLVGKRFVILDRDSKYSAAFRDLLEDSGVEVIRLPPRSPNLNAHAERFVRSINWACRGCHRQGHMPGTTWRHAAFLSPRRCVADSRDNPQRPHRSAENLDTTVRATARRYSYCAPGRRITAAAGTLRASFRRG